MTNREEAISIGHGDVDGIVSTIQIHYIHSKDYVIETVWSQPYWLAKAKRIGDLSMYDKVFVVDIALDNRQISDTMKFIQKYMNKIVIYDHHLGWNDNPNLFKMMNFKHYIDENCKSCVSLINKIHPVQEYPDKVLELIDIAHATDQGVLDNVFHKALKINPKNNETRREIYYYGISKVGGELERQCLQSIQEKADYYDNVIIPNTKKVLLNDSFIKDGVLFIDIKKYKKIPIDKTLLFFLGYDKARHVVLKFTAKDGQPCMSIATSTRINLIKRFNLPSGQPYRITLFKPKLSDQKIVQILNR